LFLSQEALVEDNPGAGPLRHGAHGIEGVRPKGLLDAEEGAMEPLEVSDGHLHIVPQVVGVDSNTKACRRSDLSQCLDLGAITSRVAR
jgi:hypothetical protein